MKTSIKLVLVDIFLQILLSSDVCSKSNCTTVRYSFELPIRACPDNELVRVFDAIFFEVNSPSKLESINTGALVDYSGAENLGTFIGVIKYDSLANTWTNENPNIFLCFPISG